MSFRFLSPISSVTPSGPRRAHGPYYYDDFSWESAPLSVWVHVFASGQLNRHSYVLPCGRILRKPNLRLPSFRCQEGIAMGVLPAAACRSSSPCAAVVQETSNGGMQLATLVLISDTAANRPLCQLIFSQGDNTTPILELAVQEDPLRRYPEIS